jgi:signal peptidase II
MLEHSMSRPSGWRWLAWLGLSAGVVVLDQVSKHLVRDLLPSGSAIRVTPFFDLVLILNPGAAFSFLSSAAGWQRELFIGIALTASTLIIYLIRRHVSDRLFCFGLGLILGGAIGNVIDRMLLGAVVDFLYFHLGEYYWPAFNLADSAISCGAALLIWHSLVRSRNQPTNNG